MGFRLARSLKEGALKGGGSPMECYGVLRKTRYEGSRVPGLGG